MKHLKVALAVLSAVTIVSAVPAEDLWVRAAQEPPFPPDPFGDLNSDPQELPPPPPPRPPVAGNECKSSETYLCCKKHEVNLPFLGVTKDFLRRHDIDPNQFAPRERIAWFCSELKVGDPNCPTETPICCQSKLGGDINAWRNCAW